MNGSRTVPPAGHATASERTNKPTPKEERAAAFIRRVTARYTDWRPPRTLPGVKAVSACRAADLTPTSVTSTAAASNTETSRTPPPPAELATALTASAGVEWVWQGFFLAGRRFREQTNGLPPAFSPDTVEYALVDLLREFADAHPGQPRPTPRAFRRRAISLTVKAMGAASRRRPPLGGHPQKAARHYLDEEGAFGTEQTMRAVADLLKPKFGVAGQC
jgi:hypothetical protein